MRRAASLLLPHLAIERVRRPAPTHAPPEPRAPLLPVDDDPGACSVPRGGGWRPGARWARDGGRAGVAAAVEALPAHRRPPPRELGRRSEAAQHPFRTGRADDGTRAPSPSPPSSAPGPLPGPRPLVLAATVGRRDAVTAACPAARALGLHPGMPLTQARALVADLEVLPADPEGDAAWLSALARHAARHWTPAAAATADGIRMDVTGCTHLFGGEERFCRRTVRFLARLGFTARVAVAPTHGTAHALARFGRDAVEIVPEGGCVQALAPLPVEALRVDAGTLAACRRFGIERVADLVPMPRGPLARRLGAAALERLDQAVGRAAEPFAPADASDAPSAKLRLLEPIGTPEAIGRVVDDLAAMLGEVLRGRGLGLRSAELALTRVDGVDQRLAAGTARATRDAAHVARLLRMRLERVDPGLGIEAGRIVATRTEPLGASPVGGLLADDRRAAGIAETVDQLAGRVGAGAVFRATLVESDVPERVVSRLPPLEEPVGWPGWRRPALLLGRPEPLYGVVALLPDSPPRRFGWRGAVHAVTAGDGPERIHGEWWVREGETRAVRDYYRVEVEGGGRYWIFRRGDGVDPASGDHSWWMHGAFG